MKRIRWCKREKRIYDTFQKTAIKWTAQMSECRTWLERLQLPLQEANTSLSSGNSNNRFIQRRNIQGYKKMLDEYNQVLNDVSILRKKV